MDNNASNITVKENFILIDKAEPDLKQECKKTIVKEYFYARNSYLKDMSEFYGKNITQPQRGYPLGYFSRFSEKFTQTEQTQMKYTQRTRSLIQRFNKATGLNAIHAQETFFLWLLARKQIFTTNTWKSDKFAVIYSAKRCYLGVLQGLLSKTNNRGGKDYKKKVPAAERNTSARKSKGVKQKDFEKIVDQYCDHAKGYWAGVGFRLFITIMCTGIRPLEVTQARVLKVQDDNKIHRRAVRVLNAKQTNGRGNGQFRTIFIDHLSTKIQRFIIRTINDASSPSLYNKRATTPEYYVAEASHGFSKVMGKIFPRRLTRITLYSARHQFAADAKKNNFSPAEIAALMGHASDATSFNHYARSTLGNHSSRIPKPLKSEVSTVRKVYNPQALKTLSANKAAANSAQANSKPQMGRL